MNVRFGEGSEPEVKYDFAAARKRREELVNMYRSMKQQHEDDATWSWWLIAQIEEIDAEIREAHRAQYGRMTVLADGHPVMHISNLVTPIVPQWAREFKEDIRV
ncbi:hypothetical protein PV433_16005 [Paenibacillus sp. GYB004]|uniref:hypothetical protein n=1 Tax=Paenibacillus sp. GYB004 TaxID=2994393 RepID=UPI002F963DCB